MFTYLFNRFEQVEANREINCIIVSPSNDRTIWGLKYGTENKFEKSSKCIDLQFVYKIPHPSLTFEQMKKNNELSGIFI